MRKLISITRWPYYKTLKTWGPLLVLLIALYAGASRIPHICLVETLFGLHCPFCGLTRACELLILGNFQESFQSNLLVLPLMLVLVQSALGMRIKRHAIRSRWLSHAFIFMCFIQLIRSNIELIQM